MQPRQGDPIFRACPRSLWHLAIALVASDDEHSIPFEGGLFARTRWSLVKRAAAGDAAALGEWLTIYWYPLYAWARRRGLSTEDAADGVQGFLAGMCERKSLGQADESRGRLRSWLLAAFGNHLGMEDRKARREKRGAGAEHVAIDWSGAEHTYQNEPGLSESPDAIYARTWALSLMEEALDVVAAHYETTGRTALFTALVPALEAPLAEATYEQTATALGMSGAAVRKASQRLRERYRKALLDVAAVRLGITTEEQLAEELRGLLG